LRVQRYYFSAVCPNVFAIIIQKYYIFLIFI
jgi:hypothetical protein